MNKQMKNEQPLHFKDEIYNTLPGSFLVCHCIFGNITFTEVRKKWYKFKKDLRAGKLDEMDLGNPEVLEKVFGMEHNPINIVLIISDWNALFLPYFIDENGEKQMLPLREDGKYPSSFYHIKEVYEVY